VLQEKPETIDDTTLARGLRQREQSALEVVMTRYGATIHKVARRIVIDSNLADDVVQETFMALWRRPEAFKPEMGRLRVFLIGIAHKKAVDCVRKEERRRRILESVPMEVTTESPAEAVEERRSILTALEKLTPRQREAIFLAFYAGLTYREVAEVLGVPEGTVKTRMRDGMIRLRRTLDRSEAA